MSTLQRISQLFTYSAFSRWHISVERYIRWFHNYSYLEINYGEPFSSENVKWSDDREWTVVSYAAKNATVQNKYMTTIGDRFKVEARTFHSDISIYLYTCIWADYRMCTYLYIHILYITMCVHGAALLRLSFEIIGSVYDFLKIK